MSLTHDTIILGAGITGLTAGWTMAREGRRVVLLEREERVGGVIETETAAGYLLEKGPNSFSSVPTAIMDVLREVGLGERAIVRPIRDFDRFVWRHGKLHKVPMSPFGLVGTGLLSPREKLRAVTGVFTRRTPPTEDLPIGTFFRERLGDGVVTALLKPFFAGIYASDADRASFQATFPKLYDAAQHAPSLIGALRYMKSQTAPGPRPKRSLVSFPDGVAELPERLAEEFQRHGGRLVLGAQPVIESAEGSVWQVRTSDGEVFTAPRVICTGPAWEAGAAVEAISPEAAGVLDGIEYAQLTIAHVGVAISRLAETRNGFGFLTVRGQGVDMLGSIWSSNIFPGRAPDGHRLLTCFYGGAIDPEANSWDDDTVRKRLVQDLKTTMGFDGGEPDFLRITRWKKALPLFEPGHRDRLDTALEKLPPGIAMLGNYQGGVSLPDRVTAALEAARAGTASAEEPV